MIKNNMNNNSIDFNNEFISITKDIFSKLEKDGYRLKKLQNGQVYLWESINKINTKLDKNIVEEIIQDYNQNINSCLYVLEQYMSNIILNDKELNKEDNKSYLEITGTSNWYIRKEWFERVIALNPNKEQIQKIYESCFANFDLENIIHIMSENNEEALMAILECETLLKNQSNSKDFNTEQLYKILYKINQKWPELEEVKFLLPLEALLKKYELILNPENVSDIAVHQSEGIMDLIRKMCPNYYLDFLPKLPLLPQKTNEVTEVFSENNNAVMQTKFYYQNIYNTYPEITSYNKFTEILQIVMRSINEYQPGNIKKAVNLTTDELNEKSVTLLVESKNEISPDMSLFKSMMLKMFEIYYTNEYISKNTLMNEKDFWKKASQATYLELIMSDKPAVVKKHKI
jgi:hypothetical protein